MKSIKYLIINHDLSDEEKKWVKCLDSKKIFDSEHVYNTVQWNESDPRWLKSVEFDYDHNGCERIINFEKDEKYGEIVEEYTIIDHNDPSWKDCNDSALIFYIKQYMKELPK